MARTGRSFPSHALTSSEWIQQFVQRLTVASAGIAHATVDASPRSVRPVRPAATASVGSSTESVVVLPNASQATGIAAGPSEMATVRSGLATGAVTTITPDLIITHDPPTQFHAARANVATSPLDVFFFGDSVTEGYDPDAGSADRITDRWPNRLLALMRTRAGIAAGGLGYLNLMNNVGDSRWAFTLGGGSGVNLTDAHAFAHQSYGLANNVDATLTFVGTSCKIHYQLGGSAFTVKIDSDAPVTVTPAAGSAYTGTFQTAVKTSGSHTVVVHPASSSTHLPLLGAFCYDGDETFGYHQWNNAQPGIGAVVPVSGVGVVGESGYVPTDQLTVCQNPPLVVICLGINDFLASVTTSDLITALQTVISQAKALIAPDPTFLLVIPHDTSAARGATTPTWASYVTAFNAVQAADSSNVALIDMSALMAAPTNANSHSGGKCTTDNVHLTTTGNQLYASSIDSFLA